MGANTWNFTMEQKRDKGPGFTRTDQGNGWLTGSTLPFTNSITGIFSFFCDSSYCADGNEYQEMCSIGVSGTTPDALYVSLNMDSGTPSNNKLSFDIYDKSGTTYRWRYRFGDENGVDWLQFDKMYQVVFSASSTDFQIAINGSTSPTSTTITENPGALNLDSGAERMMLQGASAGWGIPYTSVGIGWSSYWCGPQAWDASFLDLTTANLARIFDDNGDLKNPGENGSLWFADSYDTSAGFKPDIYCPYGKGQYNYGSGGIVINPQGTSINGDRPGGLRKSYE